MILTFSEEVLNTLLAHALSQGQSFAGFGDYEIREDGVFFPNHNGGGTLVKWDGREKQS